MTQHNGIVNSSSKRAIVPNFGLLVDLFASEHISMVTGLEYQERLAGESIPHFNSWYEEDRSIDLRLQYLSLPLLLRFRHQFGNLTPYILGGGELNYVIDSWSNVTFVFDATAGVGLKLDEIFPTSVFIETHYAVDLTTAYSPGINIGIERVSSNLVDIAIGIVF